ncbi:helix-turn-helix transcriptional regulator [Peribacillus butanolivorans]|uniref:helix-turn-helix transcriptional regulator n=1 Tax=Peribacillus butanolivorans TaxID=421767 RepID=UPI00207D5C34|nr:helix-turn-helix transcriptional regulator [Peribacillus butanolivorans]MCO0597428.1 helix-turn-helix transcriptional regulator [Peribacillus butanolivorans]
MLRELRESRGLTQQQLADRIGCSKSTISDYENLRNIMLVSTAKVIADELNCRIDDLYAWLEVDT